MARSWKRARIRVVVANVFRGNRKMPQFIAFLLAFRAGILLVNEAQTLRWLAGYRRLGAPKAKGASANDCAIFVLRARWKVHDWGFEQVTEAVPGRPVQHDRWIVWAMVSRRFMPWVRLGLVSVHANADIQFSDGRVKLGPGARWNARLGRAVMRKCDDFRLAGFEPVTGGDWNYYQPQHQPAWSGSPHVLHRQNDMTYHPHGLDGLGHAARLRADVAGRWGPGADHPTLFGVITWRERRA